MDPGTSRLVFTGSEDRPVDEPASSLLRRRSCRSRSRRHAVGRVTTALPVVQPPVSVRARGRLRALLHRRVQHSNALRFNDLVLDPDTRIVRRGRRAIELTPLEFVLLQLFLSNPERVLPRSLIFKEVWGFDFGVMSNSLNVYVGTLRRKTEAGGEPRVIHTIRGIGYVLRGER
jgi:two-component system, OmpR family, response regulator MprA